MTGRLIIRGARQNNLRGFTLEMPHRRLIVLTGPSGSGKSSLAFDTIYAEGQRRYIESLSSYAKQFLERMPRPAVDSLEGIAPTVAIEQKNPTTSSRSTVGTATEIYDHLRLLWARIGRASCVSCGAEVRSHTVQEVVDALVAAGEGAGGGGRVSIAFPLPRALREADLPVQSLQARGFVHFAAGGTLVVVDRLAASAENLTRLADSVATAFREGEGVAAVLADGRPERRFSATPRCLSCGAGAPVVTPALFSFNHPRGACPGCNGFGAVLEYDERLIVPDPGRSVAEGAIAPWTKPRFTGRRRLLSDACRRHGIPLDVPWSRLPAASRRLLLTGRSGQFVGILPFLKRLERKRYKQYVRVFLRQYQMASECPACRGTRLRPEALAVTVGGETIARAAAMTPPALRRWLAELVLSPFEREVAEVVLAELSQRLGVLEDVGLGYLTLDRQTRTLSGGEAQRISLANALGGKLVDTLYVLDEPTIGLHPRDTDRLLALLTRLRDQGNTVLVVEHDPAAMRAADYLVELGPGAGAKGGEVVFAGSAAELQAAPTLTGRYLRGELRIAVPSFRRTAAPRPVLRVVGATLHNLHGLTVTIPLGTLTVVTGVSGSGKSTLVSDVLYRHLERLFLGRHSAKQHLGEPVGHVERIEGWQALDGVVLVDQSPIGRTPRSNPVTYVKAFDEIRRLFAETPLARSRGYRPATFSFNVAGGGRCESCEGAGQVRVEMVFLADVFVPCEACGGRRYRSEALEVRLHGHSIADVLELTVDEAIQRFHHQERLGRALWHLQQVGLGYLRLGQSATTLSGGEAQRLKIARELAAGARRGGRKLYILDEPTTGLHLDDTRVLLKTLDALVDAGNTVLVIEHHLEVIKRADWVIDLGPEAGEEGGRLVAAGTPESVAEVALSHTGGYLAPLLC